MDIAIRVEGANAVEKRIAALESGGRAVVVRAMNRTLAQAKTLTRKAVQDATGLKAKTVGGRLRIDRARADMLRARLRVEAGPNIPLFAFMGPGGFKSGLGIGGRAYRLSDVLPTDPEAFFAAVRSGHRGVFKRSGTFGRRGKPYLERIKELQGPRIPAVVSRRGILESLRAPISDIYQRRAEHELERLVAGQPDA